MRKIARLAIANRGEVAVRIIRACQELGIETILLHSEVDVQTRAYRMADKKICIGPAASAESYLNIEANIRGAQAGGADAIHPGFGFLSENADFSQAVKDAGMIFVGPSAKAIRTLGDKVTCKDLVSSLGLPLIPGYRGADQETLNLVERAEAIGFPVIVKAAAGGGGRGMKLLTNKTEASQLIESAKRESLSAFGSEKIFLEKYLDRAKHIEFQVFVDASGQVVHFFDRECSVQRRHQKIIEEALSPSLTPEFREKMGEAACKIVGKANYHGAATVEFLFQDDAYYLLEVNTRLQVEHPVTELVMGVDLVKAQILTAAGEPALLSCPKEAHGHAIECRIYAENPYLGGIPSTGKLGKIFFPEGPGRRFEYGFEEGDSITSYYDPMIAKVIVWDENRPRAIQKMIQVLRETIIFGVHTNIPFLIEMLSHHEFVTGRMTTRFVERHFNEGLVSPELSALEKKVLSEAALQSRSEMRLSQDQEDSWASPFQSYWRGI